jgi:hypothetical protein
MLARRWFVDSVLGVEADPMSRRRRRRREQRFEFRPQNAQRVVVREQRPVDLGETP